MHKVSVKKPAAEMAIRRDWISEEDLSGPGKGFLGAGQWRRY